MSGTPRAVCLGETMGLLAATSVGRLAHVGEMALGIGGAESNVAIALSRLGVPTAWAGRLGADAIGDRVVRELTAERIAVHAVRDPDAPTGLMLKERLPGGRIKVWYYRSHAAGSRLVPSDVDDELIAGAELLHVTGISPALGPGPGAAAAHAVAVAREAGTTVSVDVNHRSALWSDAEAGPALRTLAASADVLYAGDDEARLVLGTTEADPETLARELAALGPSEVVIKLGAQGALALFRDAGTPPEGAGSAGGDPPDGRADDRTDGWTVLFEPAVPVEVVDPVGAGDAFVGAHLAERLAGRAPAERLRTAVTAGALMCTVPGDWEALPDRADLAAPAGPDVTR
ncbi:MULTISPECIES: sugar kinase [Pseudonocardia]|uniref:2-dehydro-3-deoxygluconokinase n=2 Tax=Pseudonocardia TaxID=1847 RepID=A0A1Y2N5M3_PSEAH|nr:MULTISPECIES: sugar kinase [Pseudonocardia]OSY42764.1 2-dehydro-3-deoxygluconokinase [Pseudonocardia autotrophica]TDN77341.1 2-dehydro-3-deoxygluconokinase [Pseudonocardia autotrophica]BBG01363.1 sugar kinase [Pseudonocardia autotrophica]GEC24419.1 sugar kinase [Pseudonocardia saturnea]